MVETVRAGRLLVATPLLEEPTFAGTVVLVVDHDEGGSLGLVLNRPSSASSAEALPAWSELIVRPDHVFYGGPVQSEVAVGLGRASGSLETPGWMPIFGQFGLVDLTYPPPHYDDSIQELRVFGGYAGWAPGQLIEELAEPAWFLIEVDASDIFNSDPERLWRQVLARQQGPLAMYATYRTDVTVN